MVLHSNQPWLNDNPRAVQDTGQSVVATQPMSATARTSSMFYNAQKNNFTDCEFVIEADTGKLHTLYRCISPNAILNAGGRADAVRCHPGTREEVIGRIKHWRKDAQNGLASNRMFWLSGPAGAGKTAIVQTIAESWQSDGIHAANFFFFRSDASRNHPHSLVSTLLYQIFEFYPTVRGAVEEVLATKPRLLEASIMEQFSRLICSPLRSVGASFSQPIILLIDGLDECDTEEKTYQGQILHALDMLACRDDLPFIILVSSRVEHEISVAFKELRSTVEAIFLDDKYSPKKDIRTFVVAEFDRIKRTHPLAPQGENWPSSSVVADIVEQSSGQFIYASTVMRFILMSSADPKLSLARVQGAAKIATKSPFAYLDAMYTYILSRVEDQVALKDILCAYCVWQCANYAHVDLGNVSITYVQDILRLHNAKYSDSDVQSCIADITTIARLQDGNLNSYHSSFEDFLKNSSRSVQYYCDVNAAMVKILPELWKLLKKESPHIIVYNFIARGCVHYLLNDKTTPPTHWNVLCSLDPLDEDTIIPSFMRNIYDCCVSDDDVMQYKQILRKWINHYMFVHPSPSTLDINLYGLPHAASYITEAEDGHFGDVPSLANNSELQLLFEEAVLNRWLQQIYKEYYPDRINTYTRLIRQWISWAVANNLELQDLKCDLPYIEQYYQQAMIAKRETGH